MSTMSKEQAYGVIAVHSFVASIAITVGLLSLYVTPDTMQKIEEKSSYVQVDDRDGKEFCDLETVECDNEHVVVPKVPNNSKELAANSMSHRLQEPQRVSKPQVVRILKKNATKAMQAKVDYAWEISHDKDFVLMIEAESAFNEHAVNINRDGSKDLGIMQINAKWHKKIVNDKNFKDWKWQIRKGYDLYKAGTTFYGFHVRHKVANRFEYQLAKQ